MHTYSSLIVLILHRFFVCLFVGGGGGGGAAAAAAVLLLLLLLLLLLSLFCLSLFLFVGSFGIAGFRRVVIVVSRTRLFFVFVLLHKPQQKYPLSLIHIITTALEHFAA